MEFLLIVEEFVSEIAGKEAVKLLHLLKDRENVSEFDLAEELKLSINQVRNLLYKLNTYNLVYSNRKKDREKGWYIYYWTFNFRHARDLLITRKHQEIEKLKSEVEKERQHKFFTCPNDGTRMELEEALEQDFKCGECGSVLKQEDGTKRVNEIETRIHKLIQDLENLSKSAMEIPQPEEEKVKRKAKKIKKKSNKKVKKLQRKNKKVKNKVKSKNIKKAKKKRKR